MVDAPLHIPAKMQVSPLLTVLFVLISLGSASPTIQSYDANKTTSDVTDVSDVEVGGFLVPQLPKRDAGAVLPGIVPTPGVEPNLAVLCTCQGAYKRFPFV